MTLQKNVIIAIFFTLFQWSMDGNIWTHIKFDAYWWFVLILNSQSLTTFQWSLDWYRFVFNLMVCSHIKFSIIDIWWNAIITWILTIFQWMKIDLYSIWWFEFPIIDSERDFCPPSFLWSISVGNLWPYLIFQFFPYAPFLTEFWIFPHCIVTIRTTSV